MTDCYSLIRDVFCLGRDGLVAQGISGWPFEPIALPDFPRDPEWWSAGGNLYEDGFAKAGFARIDIGQARAGDVLLAQVQSPVVNHGAVLLEGGIILHHLANRAGDRVSNREPVARWMRFVTHALRCTESNKAEFMCPGSLGSGPEMPAIRASRRKTEREFSCSSGLRVMKPVDSI